GDGRGGRARLPRGRQPAGRAPVRAVGVPDHLPHRSSPRAVDVADVARAARPAVRLVPVGPGEVGAAAPLPRRSSGAITKKRFNGSWRLIRRTRRTAPTGQGVDPWASSD